MNVACVMMQRNEDAALEPWLRYHGHLFGFENLYVVDHHSDSPRVLATLEHFEQYGVQVTRLPAAADFRHKASFVGTALQAAERTGRHDLLLPLDCDEFVAVRAADGTPTCVRPALAAYLAELASQSGVFQVRENMLNTLGKPEMFWALPYQKVFFSRGHVHPIDGGAHEVPGRPDLPVTPTRLVYVHFHFKTYATYRRLTEQKLRHRVDITNREALLAYRGQGWHLVTHLMKTPEEYEFMMTPDENSIAFPELADLFRMLGVDPLFCER